MNILSFIFSLLLILSLGSFYALERFSGAKKITFAHVQHEKLQRKMFNKISHDMFRKFKSKKKSQDASSVNLSAPSIQKKSKKSNHSKLNPECAKLNLWPLLTTSKNEEPFLYQLFSKMIHNTYSNSIFPSKIHEKNFVEAFLKCAKSAPMQEDAIEFEKLVLPKDFFPIYYKLLKGDPPEIPSFLDLFFAERTSTTICMKHASKEMFTAIFSDKIGAQIQEAFLNQEKVSKELLEELLSQNHVLFIEADLWKFLDLEGSIHSSKKKKTYLLKEDTSNILLRKTIYTNRIFQKDLLSE